MWKHLPGDHIKTSAEARSSMAETMDDKKVGDEINKERIQKMV